MSENTEVAETKFINIVAVTKYAVVIKITNITTKVSETHTFEGKESGSGITLSTAVDASHKACSDHVNKKVSKYHKKGFHTTHNVTYTTAFQYYYSIEIDGVTRNYLLVNIDPNDVSNIKNVLLCFPGGAETNSEFVNYTEFNYIGSPVIVFLGQSSINTYSWQNAFPQLYYNFIQNDVTLSYQNDVTFVDTVLSNLFKNTIPELFLTGKSDGSGFCVLYSNISNYKSNIKAIGICSSAIFYVTSGGNVETFDINNQGSYYVNKTNDAIIPKGNTLPPSNISLFIMHGTGDTVIPYDGPIYSENLIKGSLWEFIDRSHKNTYTVNFPSYILQIVETNSMVQTYNSFTDPTFTNTNPGYSYSVYSSNNPTNNNQVLNFITINDQDHVWSGHDDSGPNSNEPSNFTMDATYLMIKFFKLEIGNYKQTVQHIPSNLLNYNNELIN